MIKAPVNYVAAMFLKRQNGQHHHVIKNFGRYV